MAKRKTEMHRNALPLMQRINEGKTTRGKVAKALDVGPQHVTNWLRRGIPAARIPDVANHIGISTDEYRLEAGLLPKGAKGKQGKLHAAPHMRDFDALPDGLQSYIVRKTIELRRLYESLPAWLRDKLIPPKDPDQYRAWELDIETLISKFRDEP